ncbi:hypothetical protein IL306_010721 [Fusarium sp. DS 682]|nr:hypothetical protein IL306_010721 [Fusarium sp. DS 682]
MDEIKAIGSKPMTDEPLAVGKKGCLHGLIDLGLLQEKDGELRKALQSSLKEHPEIFHHLFQVDKFDKDSPHFISLASFNILVELLCDENFIPQSPEGLTPLQRAIELFGKQSIDYELLFEVIQASVNKCPQSIFIEGGRGTGPTAYHILEDKKSEQNAEWLAKAEDLLKKTCVGAKKIYDQDKKDWISQNIREKKNELLRENGVHKIFTIEIDDDGEEPHTNAAIREALRGTSENGTQERDFGIEVWKWMKFDICSETIFIAAPRVKELHLFSSANTAVLRGWASDSGLPKLQELEKLTDDVFPTNEDDEQDCKTYKAEFEQTLKKCNSHIVMEINIHNCTFQGDQDNSRMGASSNQVSKGLQDSRQNKNLEDFKSFVVNLMNKYQEGSVKIALLDDGSKLEWLKGTQTGNSFRDDGRAYFVGDCEHGTQMAHYIREVCPMAELYIARLDDSGDCENQKFSIASCLQALRWAIRNEVDFVSMSWSFMRKGSENDEYEREFRNLIKMTKNVIFFASLRDDGPEYQNKDFAPVGLDNVIRIASATTFGTASQENTHNEIDFLLPGENLEDQAKKIVSGSSYATAYAAGLAGIVLCCIKLYQHLDKKCPDVDLLKLARSRQGMSNIFCHLGQREPEGKDENGIFLMPSRTFDMDFENHRRGDEVAILEDLMSSLFLL